MPYKSLEKEKEHRQKYYLQHKKYFKEHAQKYRIEHKEKVKGYGKKYRLTHREKIKARSKKHYLAHQKEEKARQKKCQAKRRNLGFIPLNKYFQGAEGHHINFNYIIYIPKKLHRSVWHSLTSGVGMEKINKKAFQFLKMEALWRRK